MKDVFPTGPFRRDLRRLAKRRWDTEKLNAIISLLKFGAQLPGKAYPHRLSGEWEGHWECHVGSDWLLIYRITDDIVVLARTGTHADLFE